MHPLTSMRVRIVGTSGLVAGIVALAVFYPDPLIGIGWLALLPVYGVVALWDLAGPAAVFGGAAAIVALVGAWVVWIRSQC